MTGPYREMQVRLHRDAFNTPWGFRLQGGKDFKAPLTVQRVFVGSPAESELSRGDVLASIENYDATTITHKRAQDIIKGAGGTLSLRIRRGVQARSRSTSPPQPTVNFSQLKSHWEVETHRHLHQQQKQQVNRYRGPGFNHFNPKPSPAFGAFNTLPLPKQHSGIRRTRRHSDFTDTTNYRSRPLDTFTLPTPPQGPGNYQNYYASPNSQMASDPYYSSFGMESPQGARRGPDSMLNRINQNLTQSIWSSGGPSSYNNDYYEDQDYQPVSVNSLKQNFAPPPQQPQHRRYNPQSEEDDDTYEPMSVRQLQGMYDHGGHSGHHSRFSTGKVWTRPDPDSVPPSLTEPGWAPGHSNASKPTSWSPVKGPPSQKFGHSPSYNTAYVDRTPVNARPQQPRYEQPPHLEEDRGPAWAGSLKSSGGPKKWEVQAAQQFVPEEPGWAPSQPQPHQAQHGRHRQRPAPHHAAGSNDVPQIHQPRVQRMHYGPGGTQEYQQLDPHSADDSDTARVAHLQYNSPIGLYSKENVQTALTGQTSGKPGDGTMRVEGMGTGKTLDLAKSDVYRLIHEQEDGRTQSARYREPNRQGEMNYQGYQDHSRQSRSMHALEAQMHTDQPDASDF